MANACNCWTNLIISPMGCVRNWKCEYNFISPIGWVKFWINVNGYGNVFDSFLQVHSCINWVLNIFKKNLKRNLVAELAKLDPL